MIFRLYSRHRDQTPGEGSAPPRCPEVDVMQYVPRIAETDDKIQKSFTKIFIMEVFQTKTVMKRTALNEKFTKVLYQWLQPHYIRNKAFDKFTATEGR